MKSILISIKPEYVAKILNGEKTIEIRKTTPKCELPIDVYIYCTKEKPYLAYEKHVQEYIICDTIEKLGEHGNLASPTDNACALQDWGVATNGHIVAKFTLREVEKFDFISEQKYKDNTLKYNEEIRKHIRICKEACMSAANVVRYLDTKCLGVNNPSGMIGYAWHISDLEIFDKPKELNEFFHGFKLKNNDTVLFDYDNEALRQRTLWGYEYSYPLKKAPQSWCFVELRK